MYIIVEYISSSSPDNINIVTYDEMGEAALFETWADANLYAAENCAWKYKIVKL
jgi:hypothetical protein